MGEWKVSHLHTCVGGWEVNAANEWVEGRDALVTGWGFQNLPRIEGNP